MSHGFLHGFSFQCKVGLTGGLTLLGEVHGKKKKKLNERRGYAVLSPNMLRTGDMQSAIVR